jgi:hypothetical protein
MSSSSSRHGALSLRDHARPTRRARRVHVVPPSVLMLEPFVEAFSATFGVPLSDIKIANDDALDHTTIHDDHGGVQWMYLQDWQAGRGSVVLNLEGLEYDGWPIARLLERELASARLLTAARAVPDVELVLVRDAWTTAGARVAIHDRLIGGRVLLASEAGDAEWHHAVAAAYDCLSIARGRRGHAVQDIETDHGTLRRLVSPHLQIRMSIRKDIAVSFSGGAVNDFINSRPASKSIGLATQWLADWRSVLGPARDALQGLHAVMDEQARLHQ